MANALSARWHGDNYQSRMFWNHAFLLLQETSCVVEVTFEAEGPKSFDDIVIRYDPPISRGAPERISHEFFQVKWHVERGGRFGHADFIEPEFIGATSTSLLQRLQAARRTAPAGSCFTFVTTYRTSDGDPLARLISGNDHLLLTEKLFDDTTDRSELGKMRALWRKHLGLSTDAELRSILENFRIMEGHRSLEELRQEIVSKANTYHFEAPSAAETDFRYDELARQLKNRNINSLTKEGLIKLCRDEGLLVRDLPSTEHRHRIAIQSFLHSTAETSGASTNNSLCLLPDFHERYIRDGLEWERDIRPKVENFLRCQLREHSHFQLILDAHHSIAFLAGSVIDIKSGATIDLVQKGRAGNHIWKATDGTSGNPLNAPTILKIGSGPDIAVGISLTHAVLPMVQAFVAHSLPTVGRILDFQPTSGPSGQSVLGGQHAAALADQIVAELRTARGAHSDAVVHIFPATPNTFLFLIGQNRQSVAPCVIYEYDFDRLGNKTYHPSFLYR